MEYGYMESNNRRNGERAPLGERWGFHPQTRGLKTWIVKKGVLCYATCSEILL